MNYLNFLSRTSLLLSVLVFSACSLVPNNQQLENNISQQIQQLESNLLAQCNAQFSQVETSLKSAEAQNKQLLAASHQLSAQYKQSQKQQDCHVPKAQPHNLNGKVILGELEWVYFPIIDEHFKARIDSGATTSSISAKNIVKFERDGENWVRFELLHQVTDIEGREIEAKIERTVRIRQSTSDITERRHVVKLSINLGDQLQQMAEFTLADRSDMDYPILLGREFLQDITLIEVGRTYVHPKYQVR